MHFFERYFSDWVMRCRIPLIVLSVIIVLVSANGLKFLSFDTDYRVFFTEDNPDLLAFNALEATYTKSDNVFILVAPKKGDVFQPAVLAMIEALTESSWQMPYSRRVDSIQNFQNTYAEDDDLIVENLYEDAPNLSDSDILRIKKLP